MSLQLGSLPAPGERLGAYQIVAEIAHGGMAAVYLAHKKFDVGALGKLVAIKVLLPNLRGREFVDMFLDEARVAVAISHPNVVQVLDVGESDGYPYMVMEYLRGQSFGTVLRRVRECGELDDGSTYQVLAQAAAGLHAAHEAVGDDGHPLGIVHRDVKPQNIHVGYDGCAKIVDFGIAASRGNLVTTRPNMLKGTLCYLAPEQISRVHEVDRRADVWSFGVVAWEALVGRMLFGGDTEAEMLWNVMERQVPDLREVAPRIPDSVAEPIMACLRRDPALRPDDLRELEQPLARAAQHAGSTTTRGLATLVSRVFESERVREEQHTSAVEEAVTVRSDLASVRSARASTEATPTTYQAAAPLRRRRRWPAVVGTALLAGAATIGVAVWDRTDAVDAAAASSAPTDARAPAAAPLAAAPAAPVVVEEAPPPSAAPPTPKPPVKRKRVKSPASGAAARATKPAETTVREPAPPEPARTGPLLTNPYSK